MPLVKNQPKCLSNQCSRRENLSEKVVVELFMACRFDPLNSKAMPIVALCLQMIRFR